MARRINDYWLCIGVSIWTILQTILHVWWIVYGRQMFACDYEIKTPSQLYMYLAYFYESDDKCQTYPVANYIANSQTNSTVRSLLLNQNDNGTVETQLSISLVRATGLMRPFYNGEAPLTSILMYLYFFLDALWIVASSALLLGTIVQIKECSALIFFTPWMILDACGLGLDLFAAIYFGLQIPKSVEYIESEANRLHIKLDGLHIPDAAIMAIVSGRLGIIWLINSVLLVLVYRATVRAYNSHYRDERRRYVDANHNSPAARIKLWEQFYGHLEKSKPENEDDDEVQNASLRGHLPWTYIRNPDGLTEPRVLSENKTKKVVIVGATVKSIDPDEQISRF